MAKLESDFKRAMVKAVNAAGGYARRVEDKFAVGSLDLILAMPETGVILAEAKVFDGNFFDPSPRQFIEMCRIDDGGGVAAIIGVKGGDYYIHGTNRIDKHRGRIQSGDCFVGPNFPELLVSWYKEVIK